MVDEVGEALVDEAGVHVLPLEAAAAGAADTLEAAGDVGVALARLDGVEGHADRLQRRGAEAVDARAGDGVGEAGERRAVAGVVHPLLARVVGGAHHHVDHRRRIDGRHLLHEGLDDEPAHVVGADVLE